LRKRSSKINSGLWISGVKANTRISDSSTRPPRIYGISP